MQNSATRVRIFFALTVVLFVGTWVIEPSRLQAQAGGTTGTISGTVTDMTGGTVPDATVVVTNTGTGITQKATSDSQGRYTVRNLEIGDYEVQVSKGGFTTVVHKGIALTVNAEAVVDSSLSVGSQTQSVTVEAQVIQVDTSSSTLSTLMDQNQVSNLPLNGRDFEQLIQLTPGVSAYAQTAVNARQGNAAEAAYGGPGARTQGQAILFDDEDIQNVYRRGMGTVTGSSLGVEATAEFTVLTNTYGAQYGGSGIVINSASKSGTNSFHGSVYEYVRNSAMDARNFFDPAIIPDFSRNQYGASLGGPVKKEKIFFFANYEGIRQTLGQTFIATVPVAGLTSTSSNPAVAAAVNATLALFPSPTMNINTAAKTGQISEVANQVAQENYGLARIDYNISSKDSVFARYLVDRQFIVQPFGVSNTSSLLPFWPEQDNGHTDFFTTEWKRIISNSMINTVRFSFSRPGVTSIEAPGAPATPVLQFWPASSGRTVGRVSIGGGITNIGLTTFAPATQAQNRFTGAEDLLWTRGNHSLRFGGSVVRMDTNVFYPFQNGTTWSFNGLTGPNGFLGGVAQTLSGVPLGAQFSPFRQYREIDFAFYAQDDWKVTPKLTLNLGVRYAPQTNPIDAHNAFFAVLNFASDTGFTNVRHITATNPNWGNIDPRIGFAYDLFGDHKTALRGGFSINHVPINPGDYTSAVSTAPPWNQFTAQAVPYGQVSALVTAALPSASPGWNYYNNHSPYLIMYNLNIQRQLAKGTVVTVGYVGSRGVHFETGLEQNPPTVTVDASGIMHFADWNGTTLTPHPRLNTHLSTFNDSTDIANSRYNSLQATLNRRFSGWAEVQAAYTYSICIDDGNNYLGLNYNSASGAFENPYNPALDKGRCTFDIKHNFHVNGLLRLPVHGNRLVEGWQLSPIVTVLTGLPFNTVDGIDLLCNLTCPAPRPNIVSGCNLYLHTVATWFNPSCFTAPTPGTLGNEGRDIMRGPNLKDFDLSLMKETNINEKYRVQIRADAFNVLNRPNFGGPATGLFTGALSANPARSSTAGQITTTVTSSRQIQLAIKFLF